MRAFEFNDASLAEFIEKARGALSASGLAEHVRLRRDGDELVVDFSWMGTSELRYRLTLKEGGFRAEPSGEKISPFHLPFRQQFEDRFEKVVGAVGARVV
jgi:hypothetical protein